MDFTLNINVFFRHCKMPPRPGRVSLYSKREVDMAKFGLKFSLPAPGASDVAERELTMTVNGGDPPTVKTYPGDALVTEELVFDADDNVSLTLVDIDGSGNRSQPSAGFTLTVTDDVPPPQPGELGVAEKRQVD